MRKLSYYCNALMVLILAAGFGACTKVDSTSPTEVAVQSVTSQKAEANSISFMQDLATLYAKRMLQFSATLNTSADPTGAMQSLNQPFSSGVYLLGGGDHTPKSHSYREITIPSGYTHVFAPMFFGLSWFSDCDPSYLPSPGQSAEDFLMAEVIPYTNHPITLECRLNKKSLVNGNYQQYRVSTTVFTSLLHPSWGLGYGSCGEDNQPFSATSFADGYWVLIPIPNEAFVLEIGGGVNQNGNGLKGGIFRNDVTYTVKR